MSELAQRVRRKFAIRNTNGYALSALLDADTPLEIFRRLIVGSEGTLAFVAEAVIDTIAAPANTTVSWIVLPSIGEAAALVPGLVASGAEAVELMLAPALAAAAQAFPGTPAYWRESRSARRGAAGRVPRGQPGRAGRRGSQSHRAGCGREPGPPRGIHPRRGPDRVVLAGPRRTPRHRRTAAPRRYRPDHRGRVLPAGPRRRGRPGSAGTAVQAQLPAEHRRARGLRQPALHADPQARRPARPGEVRGVHGRSRHAGHRQVRRLAEGRTRHRHQHGAVRPPRVGRGRPRT